MNRRTKRVASLIRGELGRILVSGTSNPALANTSVTEVVLSNDLKQATIYYSVIDESKNKEVTDALKKAKPFCARVWANRSIFAMCLTFFFAKMAMSLESVD